ncbi:hypothetical protein FA13DRAFT_1798719 [Coprinellus micaceus]|uniref:RING-type domain-containing protein n=1 Tax=Coprinellus micaceus TaxID=71717 RepID=A0A4Y7SLB1_COPMI|nr:hypothetical protein FA13DRAFT_1798719 [Coprinellus micaceus]
MDASRTLVCAGCDRHLFNENEKFRKTGCCDSLMCEGCTAVLLPLAPNDSVQRTCPSCSETREFSEETLTPIFFTHMVQDPLVLERDRARMAQLQENRVWQACAKEIPELETKRASLLARYKSLVEKDQINKSIAEATATRLAETQEATATLQKTAEALEQEVAAAKARNVQLNSIIDEAQKELSALEERIMRRGFDRGSSSSSG